MRYGFSNTGCKGFLIFRYRYSIITLEVSGSDSGLKEKIQIHG